MRLLIVEERELLYPDAEAAATYDELKVYNTYTTRSSKM